MRKAILAGLLLALWSQATFTPRVAFADGIYWTQKTRNLAC